MKIENGDACEMVGLFFALLDAHYGTGLKHIGDGDGIPEPEVDRIRKMYQKYGNEFWKTLGHGTMIIEGRST